MLGRVVVVAASLDQTRLEQEQPWKKEPAKLLIDLLHGLLHVLSR